MGNWERKLRQARSLLSKQLSSHVSSESIDLEGGFLKVVFTNGTILYVTYNKSGEYSYGYTILIVEDITKRILGGEIVGVDAIVVTIIGAAIACDGTLENLKELPAFHPSLSEGIFECTWIKCLSSEEE